MQMLRKTIAIWVIFGVMIGQSLVADDNTADNPAKKIIEEAAKNGNKKKFDDAVAGFAKAQEIDPENPLIELGFAIAKDAQSETLDNNAAKEIFKAIQEFEKGKPDKAVKALDKGIKKQKDYSNGWYLRAFFNETQSKTDDALADYAKILEHNPADQTALLRRAQLLERKMENGAAIDAYSKLLAIDPENAEALACRGAIYEQLGDQEKAFADFEASLARRADADLAYHMGEIYLREQKYKPAITYFTQHVQIDTGSVFGYLNRGVAYYESGKYNLAVDDFFDALERNPRFTDAFYYRGMAYSELKLYQEAIADFEKVIEIDENYAKAVYQRGRVQHLRGRRKSAIADYEKTLAIDATFANAAYFKALAYDELNQNSAAKQAFEHYLAMVNNSNSEQAQYAKKRIRALK